MKMQSIVLAGALLAPFAAFSADVASATLDGQKIAVTNVSAKKYVVATLQTPADIAFKGVKAPKGSYTLYILPDGAQWQLVVNKATGAKAAVHDPKLDIGRIAMTLTKGTPGAAGPTITLTKTAAVAARLDVTWNGTVGSTRFHLDRGGNDSEW